VCLDRSKDYQKLVDGRKYAMKYRDAVASLVVQDVVDRDRGLYTCEASNVHGYATSSAALRLKGNSIQMQIFTGVSTPKSPLPIGIETPV